MERTPSLLDTPIIIDVSIPHKIDPLWRQRFLGEAPAQVLHVHLEQTRLETEMTIGELEERMKRMHMYNTNEFSEIAIHAKNVTDEDVKALVDDWGPDPTDESGDTRKKRQPAYRQLEHRGRKGKFQPWRSR